MKKYLKYAANAVLFLTLIAGIAWAAQNLQQKDSGGAVWRDSRDGTEVQVGGPIFLALTNVSDPSTYFVVSHKSGYIRQIYLTLQGQAIAPTAAIDFFTSGTAPNAGQDTWRPISSAGNPLIQIQVSRFAGWTTGLRIPILKNDYNFITQGNTIAVHSDGLSSGTVPATITIIIE